MRIIPRFLKLSSGITARQYFDSAKRQVSNLVHAGNEIPNISIKPKEVSKITIKPHSPAQSVPTMKITRIDTTQVSAADILAEQNRAMIGQSSKTSSGLTIKAKGGRNPLYNEFDRLMNSENLSLEKAQEIERLFFANTDGVMLYCPSNSVEGAFTTSVMRIIEAVKEGTFSKEIKHILIGHGVGSSLAPRSWQMSGVSVKDGKCIEIFDFINKLKLPKNEPVLVLCCEDGIKSIPNRPGIGMQVDLGLSNLGGFDRRFNALMGPGKIVRSGENKICGHYTLIDKNSGGGLVYYDKGNKPDLS